MTTPIQRSALAAALASINQAHLQFWQESQGIDCAPYFKLLSKVLNFLRGELKSENNLMRFYDEFYQWRDTLMAQDNLAYRIVELCNSALYSSVESLFDPECDDSELLLGSLADCWAEMAELGAETHEMQNYWQELQQQLQTLVTSQSRIPLSKAYFTFLQEADVSLFGL